VLLSYGAKIKLADSQKNTVLHHYAEFDDAEMVRLLISHGADPNAKNKQGRTPLMIAAENGSGDTITALVESGADVHAVSKKRETAWDLAEGESVREILKTYGLVGTSKP
jgi:ankyrin repeat protein